MVRMPRETQEAKATLMAGLKGNKDSPRHCITGHSCCILGKDLAMLHPCPESSGEGELKRSVISCLAEEISA